MIPPMKSVYFFIKRGLDISCSLIGLILLLPLFVLIVIWIKIDSPGPVMFKQVRVGRQRVPFHIYKFRTMITKAEEMGRQITIGKDPRITRSGEVLRKYKIDELPQLINVLLGDMSLVGPRPQVPYYVNLYTPEQLQVFAVRPGITDWASIKYYNESEILSQSDQPDELYINKIMPDKLRLNQQYILNASLTEDIKIIYLTIQKAIVKRVISTLSERGVGSIYAEQQANRSASASEHRG